MPLAGPIMSKVRLSIWSQAQRLAVTVACLEVRPGAGQPLNFWG